MLFGSKICDQCGDEFSRPYKVSFVAWKARRFCSHACFSRHLRGDGNRGANNPAWKGGRTLDQRDGYVRVTVTPEDESYASMFVGHQVLEHRLVMARALGRPLLPSEQVHHRNAVRDDNRLENLELRNDGHGAGATKHCLTCSCEADDAFEIR